MAKLDDNDLKAIKNLIQVSIDEDESLVRKDDIKHLPTKEEFYDMEDKIITELKAVRKEITVLSGLQQQVNNHEERIEKVERKLNIQPAL